MKDGPLQQKTFEFASRILKLYRYLCQNNNDQVIGKQILRSGTSIGANVQEALMGNSKADFIAKLHISLKETAETEFWLKLLYDNDYLTPTQFNSLLTDCNQVKALLISTLKTSKSTQ